MEFEYTYRAARGGFVGRPLIWVDLESPSIGTFSYPCLVDSGADDCTFSAEVGETMGLDIKSGEADEADGIKKDAPLVGYVHRIIYKIQDVECEANVSFTYELASDFGLLGRDGFFNHFLVKVDERNGKFKLTSYG